MDYVFVGFYLRPVVSIQNYLARLYCSIRFREVNKHSSPSKEAGKIKTQMFFLLMEGLFCEDKVHFWHVRIWAVEVAFWERHDDAYYREPQALRDLFFQSESLIWLSRNLVGVWCFPKFHGQSSVPQRESIEFRLVLHISCEPHPWRIQLRRKCSFLFASVAILYSSSLEPRRNGETMQPEPQDITWERLSKHDNMRRRFQDFLAVSLALEFCKGVLIQYALYISSSSTRNEGQQREELFCCSLASWPLIRLPPSQPH